MESRSFENLKVWKQSLDLAASVCGAASKWKDYGLRDQITRSAVSVPSNIAEGAERPGKMEFKQFLGYARGSCGELRTQLIIAKRLDYIPAEVAEGWISETREFSKMLWGLSKSLDR